MDDLLVDAREAVESAYAPYSGYRVGAALRSEDGAIYLGCNVENVNYSNSIHAEEAAVAAAVTDGTREFARLAVTSDAREGVTPCGACRQTLAEFCDDAFPIVCDAGEEVREYALGELLPARSRPTFDGPQG